MMSVNNDFPNLQSVLNRLQPVDICKVADITKLEAPIYTTSEMLSLTTVSKELTRVNHLFFLLNGQIIVAERAIGATTRQRIANG